MNDRAFNLGLGIVLIIFGGYLLWYAKGHSEFYKEKRWEEWTFRAAMLGLIFRGIFRLGGVDAVRRSFQFFAVFCIAAGVWAALQH